jgi:hypothetical protein
VLLVSGGWRGDGYIMSETDSKERLKVEFLLELRELTRKYGISIGGCGCCGSPWLDEDADISDKRAGYSQASGCLAWVAPSDDYDWRNYSFGIIRPRS